jgi:hypothetical protein
LWKRQEIQTVSWKIRDKAVRKNRLFVYHIDRKL